MIDSRQLWALVGCLSLCCIALATQAEAEESQAQGSGPAVETTKEIGTEVDVVVDASIAQPTSDAAQSESTGSKPTHKQSALININAEGLPTASVQCFCLTRDDALLAGCTGPTNEIRVFDKDGKFAKSIELPVAPEAINVAPDGTILIAGEGALVRLSDDGKVLTSVESPHAAAMRDAEPQIREQTIEQHKQQAQQLPQMLEQYDQAMKEIEKQIKALESQDGSEAQLATSKQMLDAYKSAKDQMAKQYGGDGANQLTEEQITAMVKSAMQYKTKVASISSDGDAVFVATNMPVGYGYEVWQMSPEFSDAQVIVKDLSGCCGQMDVQANKDGVFVAENSRKRVRRFDVDGTSICDWGKSSEGVDGFGSCCNPMNLAFGANGVVYTAEDTTGRIKRYSSDGKLLSVVGSADVVPGCKKVSIGVNATGDRVYMLDITRNNVAVLTRVLPDPAKPLAAAQSGSSRLLRFLGFEN